MDEVVAHYEQVREEDRLSAGIGELERIRTEEVIARHLPPPPCAILDVGGGPGVYAGWLRDRGYDVDLVDPVPRHVELARARFARAGSGRGQAHGGDARRLEFEDASRDAVLLLGPLYHLPGRPDRDRSLSEAYRVLRPGGILFAAALSRFASLLDGFSRGLVRDPQFVALLETDLAHGEHRNPTPNPAYFTTAYLHRPEDLRSELAKAGFDVLELVGIEGPFWCMPDFDGLWQDAATRALMLAVLRNVEAEPSLLGSSAHLLAIGRKPSEEAATHRWPRALRVER